VHQALTQTICSTFAHPNSLPRLGEASGFLVLFSLHVLVGWKSVVCIVEMPEVADWASLCVSAASLGLAVPQEFKPAYRYVLGLGAAAYVSDFHGYSSLILDGRIAHHKGH
jgi:hypothetical protein